MEAKGAAIRNAASVLDTECVLFRATVLGLEARHTMAAGGFVRAANMQGGFDNLGDTHEGLDAILSASFDDVEIEVVGSLALFAARNPSRT